MKNIKNLFRLNFLALGLFLSSVAGQAQAISTHYFGENAWMPDTIGNATACTDPPCVLNGILHKQWNNIKASHAGLIRFGGTAADKNRPTNYQYLRVIDSIRANGMEPIIQVPFFNYRYTAAQAAEIVHFINVTSKRNVKYWVIGNEPDLGYSYTTAAQIAAYFKPFASAMKEVDPNILIVGPELASFNQAIIDGLTQPGGASDITGKDAAGRYYLDVISFHTYPFNGSQNRAQVVSSLAAPAKSLQANLSYLNSRVASCNANHSRFGASVLKTAVTEANIDWQNDASDNLEGVGANSFLGGQFIAEMLGIGMQNGVDFVNLWSVVEGNGAGSSIGYIDPVLNIKKPAYYHFQMIAGNFKGTSIKAASNQPNVKVFASQDAQQTAVMILNEDASADFTYTVRLNANAITSAQALKINISAGQAGEYSEVVHNQSTLVLIFNSGGVLIKKYVYSMSNNAVANMAPTVSNLVVTGVANAGPAAVKQDIVVYPNPNAGKFTVKMTGSDTEGKVYEVEMFNLEGQLVMHKDTPFINGKLDIDTEGNIASGAYIVRVKDGNKLIVKKMLVQK